MCRLLLGQFVQRQLVWISCNKVVTVGREGRPRLAIGKIIDVNGSDRISACRVVDREVLVNHEVWIAFGIAGLDSEATAVNASPREGSPFDEVTPTENVPLLIDYLKVLWLQLNESVLR